ncbi:MAG: hypothetical protein KIG72_04215 [Bradymonadales bacterium]|nr:hypothetical protein [Bradymonadales bacterium]
MDQELIRYRQLTDAACKQLLADKLMLACILKSCVAEFENSTVQDIEHRYIEGDPEIGNIGVHCDTTNPPSTGRIQGMSNESTTLTEGRVTYDIRFFATTPQNTSLKLIINIEAQNDFYPGYPLIKRAFYYMCRQISAQYGSVFENSNYGDLQKVYTIWICFSPPANRRNAITAYAMDERCIAGNAHEKRSNFDLGQIVMIYLGHEHDERYTGLVKLLDVFTSSSTSYDIKAQTLKDEFGAEMPQRLRKMEEYMSGFSDYVEQRGFNRGIEQGFNRGIEQGVVRSAMNISKNSNLTPIEALTLIGVKPNEIQSYLALIEEEREEQNSL